MSLSESELSALSDCFGQLNTKVVIKNRRDEIATHFAKIAEIREILAKKFDVPTVEFMVSTIFSLPDESTIQFMTANSELIEGCYYFVCKNNVSYMITLNANGYSVLICKDHKILDHIHAQDRFPVFCCGGVIDDDGFSTFRQCELGFTEHSYNFDCANVSCKKILYPHDSSDSDDEYEKLTLSSRVNFLNQRE